MILPVVGYGTPILRKRGVEIDKNYPDLAELIANMFETMYSAHGVGLAAPQVGKAIRLFVIDATPFQDEEPSLKGFKKVFINAQIEAEEGNIKHINEGCLSIPNIREDVPRKEEIQITYFDENWKKHTQIFKGMAARIIQHEYDHTDGKLFLDHLSPLKKRMLQGKLTDISNGKVKVDYKMKFANSSR